MNNTLKQLSLVGMGMLLVLLIPDKEKQELENKNTRLRDEIEDLKNQVLTASAEPGSFEIINPQTSTISFDGFSGPVIWYRSPQLVKESKVDGLSFYPIGKPIFVTGRESLVVPQGTHALLKKNTSGKTHTILMNIFPEEE